MRIDDFGENADGKIDFFDPLNIGRLKALIENSINSLFLNWTNKKTIGYTRRLFLAVVPLPTEEVPLPGITLMQLP